MIAGVPFNGPIAAARVGIATANTSHPTRADQASSQLDLVSRHGPACDGGVGSQDPE